MNEIAAPPLIAKPPRPVPRPWARQMLNKVPEITLYFWVIKVLCTTVGETAADHLNENLGLGLTNTTYIMAALLIAVARLPVQGAEVRARHLLARGGPDQRRRHPGQRQPGRQTTASRWRRRRSPSASILRCVFATWYASERTLSVHTIFTTRREAFYWLAILFTFALGTSAGDFLSEQLELGYLLAVGIFAAAIAVVAVAHFALQAERDPLLLARLHPDPAARRLDRRLPRLADRRRRPRPRHDPDQHHLPLARSSPWSSTWRSPSAT